MLNERYKLVVKDILTFRRRTVGTVLRTVACGSILVFACTAPDSGSTRTPSAGTTAVVSEPSPTFLNGIGSEDWLAREYREDPPTLWAAVAQSPQFEFVVLGSGDEIRDVATLDTGNSTTDISLGESVISVATCCEPAAGSIFVFDHEGKEQRGDQGANLDQLGEVMARVDASSGFVLAWPEWPHSGRDFVLVPGVENNFTAGSRTIDIALFSVDPVGIAILREIGGEHVLTKFWEGTISDAALPDGRWCYLVGLAEGQFGLLADGDQGDFNCQSAEELTVIDFDGTPVGSALTLEGSAIQANSDASGDFIAYVTKGGEIRWASLDGRRGTIDTSEDYLAVDW